MGRKLLKLNHPVRAMLCTAQSSDLAGQVVEQDHGRLVAGRSSASGPGPGGGSAASSGPGGRISERLSITTRVGFIFSMVSNMRVMGFAHFQVG